MNPLQRIRLESVLLRYSWWLDIFNVGSKQRRQLRQELRANLAEAASDRGVGPAVAGLGSLRKLAAEYAVDDLNKPRWSRGLALGIGAFAAMMVMMLLASANYNNGALDAGLTGESEGPLFPFPGARAWLDNSGDGLSFGVTVGWTPIIAALVVFVLAAKPWRAFTSDDATTTVGVL